jgi:hypothetical protein
MSEKKSKSIEDLDQEYDDKFEKLRDEMNDAFTINQKNLDGEVMKTISKLHYYNGLLAEERLVLKRIIRKKNEIYGKLYEKFRFNHDMKLDKGEVQHWIERDPIWQKVESYYESHKELCDFIERSIKSLQTKSFAIKNLIDIKRIELGM